MIGLVEEQCFKFGVNELWRDSKECRFGKFVRYGSDSYRNFMFRVLYSDIY